ncbi:MAG: rhodanese-like domain-containing protein [Shimia sp.]
MTDLLLAPGALMARLSGPRPPHILDVCTEDDHAAFPKLLPGAERGIAQTPLTRSRFDPPPSRPVVVVCRKGLKLSQGAAALLRLEGMEAQALEGGIAGWAAAGLPLVDLARMPKRRRWVTGTDGPGALAAWALGRLAPHGHGVMEVVPDQIAAVADRFGAAPAPDIYAVLDRCGVDWPALRHIPDMPGLYPLLDAADATQRRPICDAALAAATKRADR